jgi:transcriptional regulator with GAF, ATPase, and Fis domain
VGALTWRKVDLRIIAATHRVLNAEVAAVQFRQELYFRLSVLVIHLPPLRGAQRENSAAVGGILIDLGRAQGLPEFCAGNDVMRALLAYDWPRNVRELKH